MALKLYGIDVNIIIDDSYSMTESMFGPRERVGSHWDHRHVRQVFGNRAFRPDNLGMFSQKVTGCRLVAGESRWNFLVDAIRYWDPIFDIMQVQPNYYTLNRSSCLQSSTQALSRGPCG